MLNGMNTCAFSTLIGGLCRVGLPSLASVASAVKLAVTPSLLTPFHTLLPVTVSTRLICRKALATPLLVASTVGSRVVGTAKPPALPVRPRARWLMAACTSATAARSFSLRATLAFSCP